VICCAQRPRLICAVCLAVSVFRSAALAADPDYATLSLEQLSSIKVTSVAKKQQRLSRTAAAVYVITSEEIHRSGLTSVPELLRLAPGLSVARINASTWAVSSRGFNGLLANKLMVLIDGRSVYSPIFSGVFWDMSMPLLDDIDRIEVIRGTGATMWGANAVNGVIDIITRSARDGQRKEVVASAGNVERASGELRGGGLIGDVAYRAFAGGQDTDQMQTATGRGARDGWSSEQGGFRMDSAPGLNTWTVEGDLFRNDRADNGVIPSLQSPPVVAFYTQETAASGALSGEWRRQIREGSELRVNAYYDDTNHPEASIPTAHTRTGDLEMQYRFAAGTRNDILVGAGDSVSAMRITGDGEYSFSQSGFLYNTASAFAQDEVHLLDDTLLLTGGVKMEHDPVGGWEAQPNARALWAPNAKNSLWASVGRAVRTPDPYELYGTASLAAVPPSAETGGLLGLVTLQATPDFKPEILDAFEIGYRVQPSPRFSLDWTAFFNDYSQLRGLDPLPPVLHTTPVLYAVFPFTYSNFAKADGVGSEISATWHLLNAWKLSASYTWLNLREDLSAAAPPGSYPGTNQGSPKNQWKLQSYVNLSKNLQTDVLMYYSSTSQSDSLGNLQLPVPPWVRVDVRAGWRVRPNWELSLVGQNLLAGRHLEFVPEALMSPSYIRREVYLRSTWRF
jgi:iron complex outermembrane receptor protein